MGTPWVGTRRGIPQGPGVPVPTPAVPQSPPAPSSARGHPALLGGARDVPPSPWEGHGAGSGAMGISGALFYSILFPPGNSPLSLGLRGSPRGAAQPGAAVAKEHQGIIKSFISMFLICPELSSVVWCWRGAGAPAPLGMRMFLSHSQPSKGCTPLELRLLPPEPSLALTLAQHHQQLGVSGEFGVTLGCLPGGQELYLGTPSPIWGWFMPHWCRSSPSSIQDRGAAPNFGTHRPQTIPSFGCTHSKNEDFHLKMWGQVPAQQHPQPGHRG